jgi:6-phosphogluconolactonase
MGRRAVRIMRPVGLALAAAALLAPVAADAKKPVKKKVKNPIVGANALYTTTNDPAGNQVIVFTRKADGSIVQRKKVSTGGKGLASEPPFGFPIVDSSGSMSVTPDGKQLFTVNAGDNTISSFLIRKNGPQLVSRVTSGGILPISLTTSGRLLYVLNEESGSIFGYRFTNTGLLTPIVNSERALSTVGPSGSAAMIGFAPGGHQLVVTQRGLPATHGVIDTFRVLANGTTTPAQAHQADQANPFGFAFQSPTHLIVSNVGFVATPPNTMPNPGDPAEFNGSTTSWSLSGSGGLTTINNSSSHARASCWVVITKDKRFAFIVNTLSDSVPDTHSGKGAITRYSVGANGALTYLGNTDAGTGFPGDEALSTDGKYLYVLDPFILGGNSHIDAYRVGSGGSLTHIQTSPNTLPNGVSGIAVH